MKLFFKIFILFSFLILSLNFSCAQDLGVSTNLNLDWQVLNSYTPPFYEGKALPGEQAVIKVLATIELKTPAGTFDSSKFFYSWKINDYYSHTYSKTGGNLLIFPLDILTNDNVVNLKVYDNNQLTNLLAEKTIHIYPQKSKAILYKNRGNTLLTYANAINKRYTSYQIDPYESFQIVAIPYYFTVNNPNDANLDYTWTFNGIVGNIDNGNSTFNFNSTNQLINNARLTLSLNNLKSSLQTDEETVNFTTNNS